MHIYLLLLYEIYDNICDLKVTTDIKKLVFNVSV